MRRRPAGRSGPGLTRRGFLSAVLLAGCSAAEEEAAAPVVGRRAPAFALPALDGRTLGPPTFAGRPLVLNFMATWCVPCKQELPAFQQVAARRADEGLAFLLVDLGEDPELVASFLEDLGVSLPAVVDESGAVTKAYRVRGLPSTFFVDRSGVIRALQLGALDERALDAGVARIV